MFESLRTHRRMLAAFLAIAAPAFLLAACNDDPLFGIPPDAPTNVSVVVAGTSATVSWTPGAGAASQEVRMSPIVAAPASAGAALVVEDDLVQTFPDNTTSSALFEDLTPGTSYQVTVTAIGGGSRVSAAPVTAVIPPEVNAPVLNTLVEVEGDPSSLYMTWTGVEGAENYRVELQAASGGDPFTDTAPAAATNWTWDSSMYDIVDGETYTAQVFSVMGTDEFGSNTLQITTDFFPWDDYFPTSLHETGQGKITYYTAPDGFGPLIGVPYEDADCIGCHSSTDGRPPVSGRTCDRCHDTATPGLGDDSVDDPATCLGCHGRQAAEQNPAFGLNDVHRSAGFTCMSCHTLSDVHGDGTEYASLQDIGAIEANCENCHDSNDHPAGANPHGEAVSCVACHAQAMVTCNNCHFAAELSGDGKVFYGPPKHDWLWLGNRPKRDGSGETEVYPVNYQSVEWQDTSFVAWGHYTPHTISVYRGCTDCHQNLGGSIEAIEEYNSTGTLPVAVWDAGTSTLTFPLSGVVPMPEDFQTSTTWDFVTTDVLPPDWQFLEAGPDAHQIITDYITPLSTDQMGKLGMTGP